MTDYWPTEEGLITKPFDGTIGFFVASSTVTEGAPQKLGTGAAGAIKVQNAAAIGDSQGIVALKGGTTNDIIPCAMAGLVKVTVHGAVSPKSANITTGDLLMNSATAVVGGTKVMMTGNTTRLKIFAGSSYVFGMAMQPSTANSDEILVYLGKAT